MYEFYNCNVISRIRTILNKEDISASKLAEKIGVQRSSISHILSERNKPSLEFIQKVCEAFPAINTEWILTGKGGYLKTKSTPTPEIKTNDLFTPSSTPPIEPPKSKPLFETIKKGTRKTTTKIITFYSDGTFDEHFPS